MRRRAKSILSGCRKNARRASAVLWFQTCRASGPYFAGPPRKQRSKTQRKRKGGRTDE